MTSLVATQYQDRRCTTARKNGEPCRACAYWVDARQRYMPHVGCHHIGPMRRPNKSPQRARYTPFRCVAYAWPYSRATGTAGAQVSLPIDS